MYVPGMLIDVSRDINHKYGLVIECNEGCVKYLDVTKDKPAKGNFLLKKGKYKINGESKTPLYVHLAVIHISDCEYNIVGNLNTNKELIEIFSYLNGYREYAQFVNENIGQESLNFPNPNNDILPRK